MKTKLLLELFRAAVLCVFAATAAAAQEAPAPAPARLVVEIEYAKDAKPAYQSVPGDAWTGRFEKVATPQPRAAAETVRAVDFKTRQVGERVEIKVGVHVGERFLDRLDEVATYTLAPGEAVTAAELERVGVAPFVFRVLRVNDADAAPPVVVNKTQSIEAAVTEFTPTPLPRSKLTLRNLSAKRVRAVELDQIFRGNRRATGQLAEREGKILLEPGATYERRIGVTEGASTPTGFTPEAIESVVVAAVVFEDYTYEGETMPAVRARAFDEGRRLQLPRVMALVRKANAAPDAETAEALNRFRAAVAALSDTAPQSSVDAVVNSYPSLNAAAGAQVRLEVEVGMHGVRRELLGDLNAFEQKFRAAPADNSFKVWLRQQQSRFEAWLSRL
ncbi:MAG TPA: hypothetical protein VNZ44_17495 [Pyrinomonadaceae bacterium]|nr:hypothetical protein [Pyrinomonadaceae bacterium]